jgi:hypothetical protein
MATDIARPEALEQVRCVIFLLVGQLNDMMFNPHLPEGLTVRLGKPEVDVALSGVSHPINYRAQGALFCSLEEFEFVQGLISGRYIPIPDAPLSLPHRAYGDEKIAADGIIAEGYGLRQHHLPPNVRALCTNAQAHLAGQVSRLVRLFRWSQNVDAPHNAFNFSGGALYWKVDPTQEEFRLVPLQSNAQRGRSPIGIRWSEDDQQQLKALLASDAEEPLAHELKREGTALLSTAPRSALLALNSALEIGVKQHVAAVAPQTAWLMEEMPSPPIHKLLRRYLPILHADRTDIPWDNLRTLCKSAQELAETRNKLAHGGKIASDEDIGKYITVVQDWIYLLDFLDGHVWAADHLSAETRKNLGWPPALRSIFRFEILLEE